MFSENFSNSLPWRFDAKINNSSYLLLDPKVISDLETIRSYTVPIVK